MNKRIGIQHRIYRKFCRIKSKMIRNLPDTLYIQYLWKKTFGWTAKLNLNNPRGFCEKLQWLKINDRNPNYTIMADKYAVRKWILETIGSQYLVPLIAVYNNPDDIDFDKLPDKFVLKCNHNSGGGMCICRDKNSINKVKVIEALKHEMSINYYFDSREWPYKNIVPKIICEEYLEGNYYGYDGISTVINYKFFCFNGEPRFLYVSVDDTSNGKKGKTTRLTCLDLEWNKTPFYWDNHTSIKEEISRPQTFEEMINISRKLSKGIPFVRVDLYSIGSKVFFSEMTFYPTSGLAVFSPIEWEYKIGDWIHLPKKN